MDNITVLFAALAIVVPLISLLVVIVMVFRQERMLPMDDVHKLLDMAGKLSQSTPTTLDDTAVKVAREIVATIEENDTTSIS